MRKGLFAVAASLLVVSALSVTADDNDAVGSRTVFHARLRSTNEVPSNFSTGQGVLLLRIHDDTSTIEFTMSYSDLSTPPAASHVHLAQRNVNGGVSFFFCGGPKPACPPAPATITGTVTAADILGPTGQGVAAGDFAKVTGAIRAGLAYANIHTTQFPGGEIRGQVE
jgi:hypothetical protein